MQVKMMGREVGGVRTWLDRLSMASCSFSRPLCLGLFKATSALSLTSLAYAREDSFARQSDLPFCRLRKQGDCPLVSRSFVAGRLPTTTVKEKGLCGIPATTVKENGLCGIPTTTVKEKGLCGNSPATGLGEPRCHVSPCPCGPLPYHHTSKEIWMKGLLGGTYRG